MAVKKYIIETRDLGKLIRGETIDLAQKKNNIRGFEIEIIDNPTNGDMIKAMFPNIQFNIVNELVWTNIDGQSTRFLTEWWKAPYKGVKE